MRKRSRYRARTVLSDPLALLRPAQKPRADAVMLVFLSALEAATRGSESSVAEWRTLADAINLVESMVELGKLLAAEVMPSVNAAIAALVRAKDRIKDGRAMRLDAAGIEALRDVIAIYQQCLDELTEREMAQCTEHCHRRMRELLRTPGHPQVVAL